MPTGRERGLKVGVAQCPLGIFTKGSKNNVLKLRHLYFLVQNLILIIFSKSVPIVLNSELLCFTSKIKILKF